MVALRRSNRPIREELPELLASRGISQRELAATVGVDQGHLSRAIRQEQYKTFSGTLAANIATALGLPHDYWPETREATIIDTIRAHPRVRDRIYDQINRSG